MIEEYEEECEWFAYRVVTRIEKTGERREQCWMGRDGNHALERAAGDRTGVMTPLPDTAKATRIWSDA